MCKPKDLKNDDSSDIPFDRDDLTPQQDGSQHDIICQCKFVQTNIIEARISGKHSLLHTEQHQTSSDQST